MRGRRDMIASVALTEASASQKRLACKLFQCSVRRRTRKGAEQSVAEGVEKSHVVASYTPSVSFSKLHCTRPPNRGTVQATTSSVLWALIVLSDSNDKKRR